MARVLTSLVTEQEAMAIDVGQVTERGLEEWLTCETGTRKRSGWKARATRLNTRPSSLSARSNGSMKRTHDYAEN
jgi:hypothetical protein